MELSSLPPSQSPIQEEIDPRIREDIIGSLWAGEISSEQNLDWAPFLSYYTKQCKHAFHDRGKHNLARTHQHILDITDRFRELAIREAIKSDLEQLFTSDSDRKEEILNNSIDLAARLYLMISIGDSKYAVSSGTPLIWVEGNLKEYLSAYFNSPQVLSDSNIKFEETFNAYNLKRIAGIKVKWTDNFIDHLRIIETDNKTVEVFHHASFLKHVKNQLFPAGLLQETLRTLALLFPPHDPDTEEFLRNLDGKPVLDKQLTNCGQLRLSERQIETYAF